MSDTPSILRCGIDLGSTTAKVLVIACDSEQVVAPQTLFSTYRRHDARVRETLIDIFEGIRASLGDVELRVCVTGSAGMGVCERLELPFVQEVVAAAEVARRQYPQVRTLLDIGGEDSKLILLDERGRADMRMNGSCAGGTGAFIDQMAVLLGVPVHELESLAQQREQIVPIASRCGVFAKTDVQNLLSRSVPKADIAASVLHAVALQTVNALARATSISGKLLLTGGPLTFLPTLRAEAIARFGLQPDDVVELENPELFSALGAALAPEGLRQLTSVSHLLARLQAAQPGAHALTQREAALFSDVAEFEAWSAQRFHRVQRVDVRELHDTPCYLGIDSGSTTTKMALIDRQGRIALHWYDFNQGDPVGTVQRGLLHLDKELSQAQVRPQWAGTAVTGYGEDLVRNVFGLDLGLVETIAHLRAAREMVPEVSFVLDIGGQDMKAMFVERGEIRGIDINEACSSGCGSFLQTFAEVLGIPIASFAEQACSAAAPCKLGSRCTVFMNSRVKQFLREGATVQDLSAGLAYSVVRNCLEKVLRIHDMSVLGDHIVVQGGTFLNPAIQRAFELLTGKSVICPDLAGVIGAWGAALVALDHQSTGKIVHDSLRDLAAMAAIGPCRRNDFVCQGCENLCNISRLRFDGKPAYFSGNRCERMQSNRGNHAIAGVNLAKQREALLFPPAPKVGPDPLPRIRVGLPRVLNLFESLPFWRTLLDQLGFEVVLSAPSTVRLYNQGIGSIMSDSLCLPAKMVHGHVLDLIEQNVDHILYPQVVYEQQESQTLSSFNCPIVTGYPEVIKSSIDPARAHGIALHTPVLTFRDVHLLAKACWQALEPLGAQRSLFDNAFSMGLAELARVRSHQTAQGEALVADAAAHGRRVILLVGRPYHLDRYINHGIPDMLADMGVDVLTTEMVPVGARLDGLQVLTQWAFPNRLYHAARYAAQHPHIEIVQMNSFGCGPDAMASDEMAAILREVGKSLTAVRIDETASPGSIRLRLRTLIETLAIRPADFAQPQVRRRPPPFTDADRDRLIIGPSWFPMLDRMTEDAFAHQGYRLQMLPPPDAESLAHGLRYVNNEVCYPAILVVGDVLRALDSGRYGQRVAVAISQTGGQCRASCYASLLGKALIAAGYDDVPIITLHMGDDGMHHQPGFKIKRLEFARRGLYSIVVADALAMMERAMLVREELGGSGTRLANHFVEKWLGSDVRTAKRCEALLGEAALAFAQLPMKPGPFPKIGIVGEIYVKHCEFANGGVVPWLAQRGVEAIVPNLTTFFIQSVINLQADADAGIAPQDLTWFVAKLLDLQTDRFLQRINRALQAFPHTVPLTRPRLLAKKASPVLSLTNQYGEGWLLTGEMAELAEEGIDNILCVQPFGCIANQVVAKGVEKRLRELHPNLNVLFIDMDHNVSEANLFNRLHFLVRGAETTLAAPDCDPQPVNLPVPQSKREFIARGGAMAAQALWHEAGKLVANLGVAAGRKAD